jgi:hypothetical protein
MLACAALTIVFAGAGRFAVRVEAKRSRPRPA